MSELKEKEFATLIEDNEPTPPKFLKLMWDKCVEVKLVNGNIDRVFEGVILFQQNYEKNILDIQYYRIWKILETKYGLNYKQIQDLCIDVLVKPLKLGRLKPMMFGNEFDNPFLHPQ